MRELKDRDTCVHCGSEMLDIVSFGGEYIEVSCRGCKVENVDNKKIKELEGNDVRG